MPVKTMRYEISNPVNIDWAILNSILNEIQFNTWKASNIIIQQLWAFNNFSRDYYHRIGTSINLKEEPIKGINGHKYTSVRGEIANVISPHFKKSYGDQKHALVRYVCKLWERSFIEINKGSVSIPSFKRSLPIILHLRQMLDSNKNPLIFKTQNRYSVGLKLLSKKYATELGLSTTTIKLNLVTREQTKKDILNRIMINEYKLSGSKLQYNKNKNKWFLLLTYSHKTTNKIKQIQNDVTIMGIDLGIRYPVFMAFNNMPNYYKIEGSEITEFRRRINARRLDILKQSKYCGEGRRGHGRQSLLKPTEKLRNRVENFRDSVNHVYSSYIIKIAKKHNVSVIQLENLTGIAKGIKRSTFLGQWTYYDLQTKLEYKANNAGIKVIKVNPNFTSQRCSKCGFINKENRDWEKDSKHFKCIKCNYESLADLNAARNLATLNIEEIISDHPQKNLK